MLASWDPLLVRRNQDRAALHLPLGSACTASMRDSALYDGFEASKSALEITLARLTRKSSRTQLIREMMGDDVMG